MANLLADTAGIRSPNPFWIASGPPGNSLRQVRHAFELGWGGVVWKTIGAPVIDTAMRYGGHDYYGQRLVGLNNIELISDRPIEVNLAEMKICKEEFPDRALIASLMVETEREAWHEVVKRTEAAGVDGFELNFGCPHGMSERNMGAAVGQVPEYVEMITSWVKEVATIPVLVKLTPNITNIEASALAAKQGGADGLSAINTINSIIGVDLATGLVRPSVAGKSSHGGYAGPAVKPIALHMVSSIAHNPEIDLPISGIGGAGNWRDAAEFILLGASTVQVCTAIMHHGFRIIEDMCGGLSNYLDEHGKTSLSEIVGGAVEQITNFGDFDLNHKVVASIDEDMCIGCGKCIEVCHDNQVDCISWSDGRVRWNGLEIGGSSPALGSPIGRVAHVDEEECIGCDLCSIVCPVHECITMTPVDSGLAKLSWRELTDDIGVPGLSSATSDLQWEQFPAAIAGKVHSHGLVNTGE